MRDKDKVIYEAMLSAAPEFPDEVAQMALELSGRRDEPAHATQRRDEERERRRRQGEEWKKQNPEKERARPHPVFSVSSLHEGPMRPAAPDGPSRAVPDGFRAAILETPALNGLINVRPSVAKEVLLAVCIDEPKHYDLSEGRFLRRERLGLADWQQGYPAMYWKGPFLPFLQRAPEEGLDAIVRLVNYATERWIEDGLGRKPTEQERRRNAFKFEINGKAVYWVGDCNVFGWHRYLAMGGAAIECALMALEKWLYDEIENGRGITRWVQYIFDHSQSAAFAGLLIAVGLRYPAFFARDLQPLIGNFYVYECQTSWALNESSEVWTISFARQPDAVVKIAASWHRMPHRRYLLRDIVPPLMLSHEGTLKYITERKAEWAKLRQGNAKSRLDMEFFLARFDPANYTETPQDYGQVMITMQWPPHLDEIAKRSQGENELKMLSMTIAMRARRLLEGQESLKPEQVPAFAAQVRRLTEWKDASDKSQEHYRISSLAGGLAVLVIQHRAWLATDPDFEKWCLATLRDLKPVEPEHFSPAAIDNHSAEAFLGEAGVALLLESNEEWVVQMALEGITGAHYSSTLFTMWRAYLLRRQLGEKFGELLNVVVQWSALRRAAIRESGYYADTTHLAKYRAALLRRLVAGRLKGPLIPLRRAETLGRSLVERIERRSMSRSEREQRKARREWRQSQDERKLDREMPDIDLEVIQKGFGFVAAMIQEGLTDEETTLRRYVDELFDLLMRSLPRPDNDADRAEIEGTPYESDRWILLQVAEFIARTNSLETGRAFFRPILQYGPAARYWVEDFLDSWTSRAIQVSPDLQGYAKIWQDMVAYTETLPAWDAPKGDYWSRAEGLSMHLMGLSESGVVVLGQPHHQDLVASMAGTFERWGSGWLRFGSPASWFAYFLRTESAQILLPQGVKQLAAAVDAIPGRDWQYNDLGGMLTEVLSRCWKHYQNKVEKDSDLRAAFLHLLAVLCARQIPEALHLRTKVSEALGASQPREDRR